MATAAELMAAERETCADALVAALRAKQFRAERVDLSPSPSVGVNVWLTPGDRYPETTVVIDDAEYAWGHKWEHTRGLDVSASVVAEAIEAYLITGSGCA